MSLTVTVELLHGTIRAGTGAADRLVDDPGEWPPSPARLFSAFVAADGSPMGRGCRVTSGAELGLLELAGPPVIVADPRADHAGAAVVTASPHRSRYVVVDANHLKGDAEKGLAVQEYVARTSRMVRPSTLLAPCTPTVAYHWDRLDVDDAALQALRLRAARIGYLGCADSPVRVTVSRAPVAPEKADARTWRPHQDGTTLLPVPFDGLTSVLDRHDADPRAPRARNRIVRMAYRSPVDPSPDTDADVIIWLRLERPLSGRRVLALTNTLRAATLQAWTAVSGSPAPPVLTGHGEPHRRHARWLALPNVGHPHADGRIHGAAVVLPAPAREGTAPVVRQALSTVRTLFAGAFAVGVHLDDRSRGPWAANPRRWTQPATRFVTAFPMVHETFTRPAGPRLPEIAEWCRFAGLPSPVSARTSNVPLLPGALALSASETRRNEDGPRRPFSHLLVEFGQPVTGPVSVGQMRHFGLGLLVPQPS